VIIDQERAPYIVKMFEMSASGKSGRHIRQWLEDNIVKTRGDKSIPLSMIHRMLGSTFYYGEFEYPKNSGKWYQGNHSPLITKELFDKVQIKLKVPAKPKWGSKEFPYKKFLKCYKCGSSIVGEQKIRNYKNGNTKIFTYYHCSRQVDRNCKEPYAKESVIADQLSSMCNELITDIQVVELNLRKAMDKFARMMAITHTDKDQKTMIGAYIKYVLKNGTTYEKTRLIRNLDIKLALHDRKLIKI